MNQQRPKVIIFDFDGTIADSFSRVVEIAQELIGRHEKVSAKEIERLRGLSAFEIAKEMKIHPWRILFLVGRGRRRMRSEMENIHPFKDMPETIAQLSKAGHKLYIMSSNSVQNIRPFLERHAMGTEFIKIYGGVGIFGKAHVLKKLLKQNDIDAKDAFYVGDEVRDIEAAKRAGVKIISVTWGYNNEESLNEHQPDFVVHQPREIVKIVTSKRDK